MQRTVITAIENLADAISMSILNGQQTFTFAGRAQAKEGDPAPTPSHCFSEGSDGEGGVPAEVFDRYEADARFVVADSSWGPALEAANLRQWNDPNEGV